MHSTIALDIAARADLVFDLARDSSAWERLLPHYARSRAIERRADGRSSSTSWPAGRSIGVLGLGLPVAWRSRTWSEPATRRLRFVHVAGATEGDGRDVADRDAPAAACARGDRPRFPAARRAVRGVRRPSVHPSDRRPDAGNVPCPGRSPRRRADDPIPRPRRSDRHDRAATDLDHRDRRDHRDRHGQGGVPGRAPGRPVAGQPDRPLRSDPRSGRRSPRRSTTSIRSPGCRPRSPASSTGSASSGWSPAGSRSTTRA